MIGQPQRLAARLHAAGLLSRDTFADPAPFLEALTHSSFATERGTRHNERLEMLGDAVLGFLVARMLYDLLPEAAEGVLTRLRASLVEEPALAAQARKIGLGDFLLLGHGEERSGGRCRDGLLADAFEAMLAAMLHSEGLEAVRHLVERLFEAEALQRAAAGVQPTDFKSALQVRSQARWKIAPTYRVVGAEGLEHAPTFLAEVLISGESVGSGTGRTKKEAQQKAAAAALERFDAITSELSERGVVPPGAAE